MTVSLIDQQNDIINMLREGQFVEGMEKYYADDAINEEASGEKITGKAAIIANEKNILENVAAFHGIEVKSVGVGNDDGKGNGTTFVEYAMSIDLKDGTTFNPSQVQVTRWESGKAKRVTFYYDPAKI